MLSEVNLLMCSSNFDSMFFTVFFCVLDPSEGLLLFAVNAGHPAPFPVVPDGSARSLECADDVVLGLVAGAEYELRSVSLSPGEFLFM